MIQQRQPEPCLHEGTNFPSPFTRVLALGYYDGPTNGLAQCGEDGPVYKFDLLDELYNPEGLDLRAFALAPAPRNSLAELITAYSPHLSPQWPLWVPLWMLPTKEIQQAMERVTDEVLGRAGAVEWILAAADLLGELQAARTVRPEELSAITDWFAFLGITHAAASGSGDMTKPESI